ncbi:S-methyl-5-thioribose-1-phosphate isomerase [Aciditerrimonas ferrireducens]|nr:S-methyl-5-thioribose-1-phosphate isomerase [Aciditerrimonas ferrireducens]MCK4178251.1 S-methyl-5-thioribose-1-phosphate isomerase [Aciditerrimonas ferrireducens]
MVPPLDPRLPAAVAWDDEGPAVLLLDQRALPEATRILRIRSVEELCSAISGLAVRGAPALGVAGAYGIALAERTGQDPDAAARLLLATRPTAVNLRLGVEHALGAPDPLEAAHRFLAEDLARHRRLGANGAGLLLPSARVLTHCHAGALACGGYGTALGVVRAAAEAGATVHVWVRETRPLLQGSRITAWELQQLGIPATVLVDGAAASLFAAGQVDCCLVGADRIAANGDVANKVGTYDLAVLAHHHGVPFYVAAPSLTVDLGCPTGSAIPIEQRAPEEVTELAGRRLAPEGVPAYNPAFDVTPAELVTAIVTEAGVHRPPYSASLAGLAGAPSPTGPG